jgi:pantoate--beta-alanine ligase
MAATVVTRTRAELETARAALPGPVGAVFTMGALHEGHQALLRAAREANASLLVTIFVNPRQFGPNEDLSRYPRPFDEDLARCDKAGVDVVWAPSVAEVYRSGEPQITVEPGQLAAELEGASRPGHFAGVLTVVAKLLHLTRPDRAYFGEKDFQQLALVRRMVADLDFDVEIVGVPTVREPDGLALSSRNVYLSAAERDRAVALSTALETAAKTAARGAGPDEIVAAGRDVLGAARLEVDYFVLRGADLGPAPRVGPARVLVAARVGGTRLIDNVPVTLV